MKKSNLLAVCTALLAVAPGLTPSLDAAELPSLRGPIALVGGNRIEEADIQRAALVFAADPLRARQPARWRKKLVDFCIDRELLAMEAEGRGFLTDPAVKHEIERRIMGALYLEVRDRVLLPAIEPTAAQIDTARAAGGFRRVKLSYILTVADREATFEVFSSLRRGASFDSVAKLYSIHPCSSSGGHLGWKRIRELNPASWGAFKTAKPGELLGPYPNSPAHEIYKVEAIEEPTDADIRDALTADRTAELESRYYTDLQKKYKFSLNPTQVSPVIFAAATERADSILASLAPDGTRLERGVHPPLGVLARVDGDSITYADIATPDRMPRDSGGKSRIEDTQRLYALCTAAFLPRLVARDAHERGIDRDLAVARRLRLIREEVSTRAMVARAAPAHRDSASLRAYFESHAERYQRPPARRALVAMFAKEDSARSALLAWNGAGFLDSALIARGFQRQERASAATLLSGYYAEVPLFETDTDPMSLAARALDEGQLSPVVQMPTGFALARVVGREPARPLTFAETAARVAVDLREESENAWVVSQLVRLRTATPVQRFAARLEAMRLDGTPKARGKRR